MEGFAEQLDRVDVAMLMEIYPAREEPIEGVTSEAILDLMKNGQKSLVRRERLGEEISSKLNQPTVLLTLGAGDIDREVPKLKSLLAPKYVNL